MQFTFVIPVHNAMSYIRECITSILRQSCQDFDVVVLENKSDDGTAKYLQTLSNHPKIRVFPSDRFLSIEDNWKRILKVPKNPYMIITGPDDSYEKDYLASIKELIEKHPHCSVYRTNMNVINTRSKKTAQSSIKEKIDLYDYLTGRLKHTYFETMAGYTIKTQDYERIGGIDCVHRLMHTDDKLIMQLIGSSYMAVSPSYEANYRSHRGSESGSPNPQAAFDGFMYFFRWILQTKDQRLINIVRDYLPLHLQKINAFLTPDSLKKYQEIYPLFQINADRKKDIHICLASDKNYVSYMATTMVSALASSQEDEYLHFHLFCDRIPQRDKQLILQLKSYKDCEIHFVDLDIAQFQHFPAGGKHITNTTYFRYVIPEMLPTVDKVIWLDCDVIVKESLWELYNTDLEDCPVGAVEDVGYVYWRTQDPSLIYQGFYINAGVLLINAKQWRQERAGEKLIQYTQQHQSEIRIGDQDVINSVFKGRIKELDYKWNVQDSFLRAKPERAFNPRRADIAMAAKAPAIIHYTSENKPWNRHKRPLAKAWFKCNALLPKEYRKNLFIRRLFNHGLFRAFGIDFR